jgi:hypothetical protein
MELCHDLLVGTASADTTLTHKGTGAAAWVPLLGFYYTEQLCQRVLKYRIHKLGAFKHWEGGGGWQPQHWLLFV